jgi:hypothetical protein
MTLSFKLLNTSSSALTCSRSVSLALTWFLVDKKNTRPNFSFHLYSLSQPYPYTDGTLHTVSGSGLLLWLSYSTAKGIDPFLCYVKPSVRIST